MNQESFHELDQKMQKILQNLKTELDKIRTGRAHPSFLDQVRVLHNGQAVPINRVASISVEDARTLSISPWEKTVIVAIEKGILAADLNVNPIVQGNTVKISLPPLTEQRRKELVKSAKGSSEDSKIALRNIRRDWNNQTREAVRSKLLTTDEEKRWETRVQKLMDSFIDQIENMLQKKEQDLLSV